MDIKEYLKRLLFGYKIYHIMNVTNGERERERERREEKDEQTE